MAHFAQIDENNVVLTVIVVNNADIRDAAGVEREAIGVQFCKDHYGSETAWVQTSYNSSFRKNYAGIGHTYDAIRDAFIPRQPYPSWLLDEATCRWRAPVPYPADGAAYEWDESQMNWIAA